MRINVVVLEDSVFLPHDAIVVCVCVCVCVCVKCWYCIKTAKPMIAQISLVFCCEIQTGSFSFGVPNAGGVG